MKHSKGSVRTDGYEGRLAQLEERLVCNQKAGGSNPPASTIPFWPRSGRFLFQKNPTPLRLNPFGCGLKRVNLSQGISNFNDLTQIDSLSESYWSRHGSERR